MKNFEETKKCIIQALREKSGYNDLISRLEKVTKLSDLENLIIEVKDSDLYRKILLCFNK